jgi:hypothetical protein
VKMLSNIIIRYMKVEYGGPLLSNRAIFDLYNFIRYLIKFIESQNVSPDASLEIINIPVPVPVINFQNMDMKLPKINKFLLSIEEKDLYTFNKMHENHLNRRNRGVYRSIVFRNTQE